MSSKSSLGKIQFSTGPFESLKAAWEMRAGIVPGKLDHRNLHKIFCYTFADYDRDREMLKEESAEPAVSKVSKTIFQIRKEEAVEYWDSLNDPRTNNWAELTFIWY